MSEIWLRYDLRSSPIGATTANICQAALEQAAWADDKGFDALQLPEHHGSPDGYNPSPLILGASFAARTSRMRLVPCAILLPFHDPIRIAEDAAVLDNLCGGRLDLTAGVGYVPSEFALFGVAMKDRARLMDEKLSVLRRAMAGERFQYGDRTVYVSPRPVQQPHPKLLIGGAVAASARRAAQYGDGFFPLMPDANLLQTYRDACAEFGKSPGPIYDSNGPLSVHVAEDPDAAWARVGPYFLHETRAYGKWAKDGGAKSPFESVDSIDKLRDTGLYQVVTADQCLSLCLAQREKNRLLSFTPLVAGMPAELGWSSLELFVSKVLPRLRADGSKPIDERARKMGGAGTWRSS